MKRLFAYPYIVWMIIFIVVPLVLVGYYSITGTGPDGETYFTLAHFRRFFAPVSPGEPFFDRVFVRIAVRSIRLAIKSTAICFALGYPVAYIMASPRFRDNSTLLFLLLVPMWMNLLVRTYAWLAILGRNGFLNRVLAALRLPTMDILFTDSAVLLGMVYNFLPFMILPIYAVLKKMDPRIIEAAQDLGANQLQVFLRVTFPLSMPGVASGITMVFMPSAATFIIANLLGGGQYFLLGNLVEQQFLRTGNWHFGSAVTVIMMLLMLISIFVLSRVDRDDVREGGTLF